MVEYKSLPSGLHNVTEDLVYASRSPQLICPLLLTRSRYFVHEQYAGISAFLNHPATEAERNAKMFAIGVVVPLSTGRLGRVGTRPKAQGADTVRISRHPADGNPN